MKQLRFNNQEGRMEVFVQKDDLNSLLRMKGFISPELYDEAVGLLQANETTKGLYRITDSINVEDVCSYGFIVDYDKSKDMDVFQTEVLRQYASDNFSSLSLALRNMYNPDGYLSKGRQQFVDNYPGINIGLIDSHRGDDNITTDDRIACAESQVLCYIHNLRTLSHMKQEKSQNDDANVKRYVKSRDEER